LRIGKEVVHFLNLWEDGRKTTLSLHKAQMKISMRLASASRIFAAVLVLATLSACEESGEETLPSTGAMTISGTFNTPCVPISGGALAGESYTQYRIRFQSTGAFETSRVYASNNTCTANVYQSNQTGTYSVGAATTAPAGGFKITLVIDNSYIITWTGTASTNISGGCPSNVSWPSGTPKLGVVYGAFSCANITIGAPATFYNVIVATSATTLSWGTPTGDNPGVTSQGAVPTSAAVNMSM
jgi:hypothetical protein